MAPSRWETVRLAELRAGDVVKHKRRVGEVCRVYMEQGGKCWFDVRWRKPSTVAVGRGDPQSTIVRKASK